MICLFQHEEKVQHLDKSWVELDRSWIVTGQRETQLKPVSINSILYKMISTELLAETSTVSKVD